MKAENSKSILLISPEPWHGNFVSKHHYAQALVRRGFKVYFFSPPIDGIQETKLEILDKSGNLFEVRSLQVASGLRFYPGFLRQWLEARWLKKLEKLANVRIDVIWLFENSRFFDMSFAGNRLKIYHQVDLNQDFQAKTAAKTADICFTTTDFISQRLMPHNPLVYKIHHGVSIADDAQELPTDLIRNFKPAKAQVGYIGNLDIAYLDVPLLSGLVKAFPEVTFHFVGGYRKDGKLYQACANAPNVVWWGQVESSLIPAVLKRCDILLVTYLAEAFKEQLASPHKMMEYLASGKTIVATYTDEYKDKRRLLEMVDNSGDFQDAFAKVIAQLNIYNSIKNQVERIEYARQNNYDRQLDSILGILKNHGFATLRVI